MEHQNIVKLLGLCEYKNRLFIITEYVKGGDLRSLLKNREKELTWEQRAKFAIGKIKLFLIFNCF